MTELLVSRDLGEIRVALLDGDAVREIYIERASERSVVGNIYRGRVTRVLPGMQAAFVEIGLSRAAFLYVDDILNPSAEDEREEGEEIDADFDPSESAEAPPATRPAIRDLVSEGDEITVQVTKAPIGTKGARVTTYVTIPGRAVVYMPTIRRLGVSRKITDEDERKRLKDVIEAQRNPDGGGFIARTACVGLDAGEIGRDMAFVQSLWTDVERKSHQTRAPGLLQPDLDLVLRATRDLFTDSVTKLVVNQPEERDRICRLLSRFAPHLSERVETYEGPLFAARGVEDAIAKALQRTVPLKSGGSIVIDEAEAFTAIDVNTGSYVGSSDLEATILKTNLEAAKVVAEQVCLRNLGGIIIVDFIDMQAPENREKVQSTFSQYISEDRARTQIQPMSELGLIQFTRKRVRPSLGKLMTEPCPYCEGRGWVKAKSVVCQSILRDLAARSPSDLGKGCVVSASAEVASLLTGSFAEQLEQIERELRVPVVVEVRNTLHQETYEVLVRR